MDHNTRSSLLGSRFFHDEEQNHALRMSSTRVPDSPKTPPSRRNSISSVSAKKRSISIENTHDNAKNTKKDRGSAQDNQGLASIAASIDSMKVELKQIKERVDGATSQQGARSEHFSSPRSTLFERWRGPGRALSGAPDPMSRAASEVGDNHVGIGLEDMMDRDWGDDSLTCLGIGDMITLTLSDVGLLVGDVCLSRLGVEHSTIGKGRLPGLGGAPEDCAFRICPKLNYRTRREMNRLEWVQRSDQGVETTVARLKDRLEHERVQNEHLMQHVRSRGKIVPIFYGDIVQLEHVRCGKFVGMLEDPALLNTNNYMMSLLAHGEDGTACYFRVVPRFKVRSVGSKVFSDDEVVLESVKFNGFVLSASTEHAYVRAVPKSMMAVPRILRQPRTLELSGWLVRKGIDGKPIRQTYKTPVASRHGSVDLDNSDGWEPVSESGQHGSVETNHNGASFQLKLYARFNKGDTTERLTTFSKVRLFHPEFNGYLQASSNRDKGETLDSMPEDIQNGLATRWRWGKNRAHCPYLKPMAESLDPSAPTNLCAKAVWRFERLDDLSAGAVCFNEPIRIRHVATNKFLAVDLSLPGVRMKNTVTESAAKALSPSKEQGGEEGKEEPLLRAALGAALEKGLESIHENGCVSSRPSFSFEQDDVPPASPTTAEPFFYDCFITDGKEGTWASGQQVPPDAMVFRIVPTDEEAAQLKQGLTTIRIEHRTPDGQRLFLSDINDAKPRFTAKDGIGNKARVEVANAATEATGGSGGAADDGLSAMASWGSGVGKIEPKCRIGFVARSTGFNSLVVRPVMPAEDEALEAVLNYLEPVNRYAHRYLTAIREPEDLPVDACEELVGLLLDLLDLLQKGTPCARRHKTVADHMKEAIEIKNTPQLSLLYFGGGEVNPKVQALCCETKLLDALFTAAVAPYNRQLFERGPGIPGPFDGEVSANYPAACQKFIYLCIQRICFGNEIVMQYFAHAKTRVWRKSSNDVGFIHETEVWRNLLVDQGEDGFGASVLLAQLFRSSSAILKKLVNDDLLERFKLLIRKCGPQGRLINLFASTCVVEGRPMRGFQEACVRKLWMSPIDRYNLGVTFHETTAEAVMKAIKGHKFLRFPYGAPPRSRTSTHEQGVIGLRGHVRFSPMVSAPDNYLGKSMELEYPPVAVVWRSNSKAAWGDSEGRFERDGLFWSPQHLDIPSLQQFFYPKGDYPESEEYLGELVPLELLFWVLEPERLCLAVTGKPFEPFVSAADARKQIKTPQSKVFGPGAQEHDVRRSKLGRNGSFFREVTRKESFLFGASSNPSKESPETKKEVREPINPPPPIPLDGGLDENIDTREVRRRTSAVFKKSVQEAQIYNRKKQLASYTIDQVNLLTQMCRGRCVNAIRFLEKDFSYSLLLNIACNPWLPYRLRAVVVHLILALYVDRYPQIPKCGAAQLPEAIWIYEDDTAHDIGVTKKSTTPVLNSSLTLDHKDAFPGFFIPVLSMAHGGPDPVLSMPDHTKFFLLRNLCNELLENDGLVYDDQGDGGFNLFTAALLKGQSFLLNFGFQSTYEKIKDICKPNAMMLDGRSDQVRPGQAFNPPELRYHDMGQHSDAVVGIKQAIIDEFFDLADLRVNYRLSVLLGKFKSKLEDGRSGKIHKTNSSFPARVGTPVIQGVETIGDWAGGFELYQSFEGLFQLKLPQEHNDDLEDSENFFVPNISSSLNSAGHETPASRFSRSRSTSILWSKHDAHALEFGQLADKADFEDVLIDTLLYDNDQLMAASLRLLDVNYGMRRRLVESLSNVVLLEDASIPVFGKVHALRSDINELAELLSTHTVWCVNSIISGDFDQKKYGRLMSIVDSLLEFIYAPEDIVKDTQTGLGSASNPTRSVETTSGDSVPLLDRAPRTRRMPSGDVGPTVGHFASEKDNGDVMLENFREQEGETTASMAEKSKEPVVNSEFDVAATPSTVVFLSALQRHFDHHTEYGVTEEARCFEFFRRIESADVSDGLVNLFELEHGVRDILGLTRHDLSDAGIRELFDNLTGDGEFLNLHKFETFVTGHGDKENYLGIFMDCDKSEDGTYYRASRIFSTDVGAKWLDRLRPHAAKTATASNASAEAVAAAALRKAAGVLEDKGGAKMMWKRATVSATGGRTSVETSAPKPCAKHQNILRAGNLQSVLSEAVLMDPDIAFKGSKCTVGLKIESQRRLTLVSRALLVLFKGFVHDNKTVQGIMFKDLKELQRAATPVQLMDAEGFLNNSFDERVSGGADGQPLRIEERHYDCFCVRCDDHDLDTVLADRNGVGGAASAVSTPRGRPKAHREKRVKVQKIFPSIAAKMEAREETKMAEKEVIRQSFDLQWQAGSNTRTLRRNITQTFGMSQGAGFPVASSQAWPTTVAETAQDVIMALVRGNEELCLRLSEDAPRRDSLFDMFAFLCDQHERQHQQRLAMKPPKKKPTSASGTLDEPLASSDMAPALDFFFIMCAPTASRPLRDFQTRVGERLCDFARFGALAQSCASSMRRVRSKAEAHCGANSTIPFTAQQIAENPYRMVRLIKACCQGGNDEVTMLLSSASAMVGVEECCRALLAHFRVDSEDASTSTQGNGGGGGGGSNGEQKKVEYSYVINGEDILRILSPPSRVTSLDTSAASPFADKTDLDDEMFECQMFKDHNLGSRTNNYRVHSMSSKQNSFGSITKPTPRTSYKQRSQSTAKSSSTLRAKGSHSAAKTSTPQKPRSSKTRSFSFGLGTKHGNSDAAEDTVDTSVSANEHAVVGAAALTATESYEDGCLSEGGAFEVLALLVELVDLLPLSSFQVRSPLLWECVGAVCVPAVNALARARDSDHHEYGHHSASDRVVCAELIDLLDRLLAKVDHHKLIEELLADQYRAGKPFVDNMRDDLYHLAVANEDTLGKVLSKRSREAVGRIFMLCDDLGDSLPVAQFCRKDAHVHDAAHVTGFDWIAKQARRSSSHRNIDISKTLLNFMEGKLLGAAQFGLTKSFDAFVEGVKSNPHVGTAILRRRFELLTVLERGTHPDPAKYKGTSAVAVTWEMLVKRFVKYAKEDGRFSSNDHYRYSTCHIILRLLRDHLVKARTHPLDSNGNVVMVCEDTKVEMAGASQPKLQRMYDNPRVVALETVDASDLPSVEDRRAFVRKQHMLLKHGCVDLTANILMATDTAEDGDLADEALEALDELLHGGDLKVRRCLYDLICRDDHEGRFLAHLVGRMTSARSKLLEGRQFEILGSLGKNMTEEMKATIEHARRTVRFLAHLCTGHHTEFQDILREQGGGALRTYDLVEMCIELLCNLADSHEAVMLMSGGELGLIRDLLVFLYQVQEGPNPENQYKVAFSDVFMAINLIVAADSQIEARLERVGVVGNGRDGRVTLEALCFRVLSACLEGRVDSVCHDRMQGHIEVGVLYEKARALDNKCRISIAKMRIFSVSGDEKAEARTANVYSQMEALTHLWNIHFELFPHSSERATRRRLVSRERDIVKTLALAIKESASDGISASHSVEDNVGAAVAVGGVSEAEALSASLPVDPQTKSFKESFKMRMGGIGTRDDNYDGGNDSDLSNSDVEGVANFDVDNDDDDNVLRNYNAESISTCRLVGTVEVAWEGKTQLICFPMPLQASMLTAKTKEIFLYRTRLYTTEKRLELLLGSSDLFISEMNWVQTFSEYSGMYRSIRRHLSTLKLGLYCLVLLLNVNVMLSPPSLSRPLSACSNLFSLTENEKLSLGLTLLLGTTIIVGYFLLMCYAAATTMPIMISNTDKNSARDRKTKDPAQWTNINAFKWWAFTLLFNVMFIIMHVTNSHYSDDSVGLYAFLLFGINLPWTLGCLRNYIVVPTNEGQRLFVIVFDTVVKRPSMRNHLLLQILSVSGFISSEWFTLMLFDVINISTKLGHVMSAIMWNADSLGLIFFLFLATTLTYSAFGIHYFPSDFTTTFDGTTKTFKTVLSAFWFLFYGFASSKSLKGYLQDAEPKSENWLARIFFDTSYFVWVGIILVTTITALLVDGLGSLRTDAALRRAQEKNVCFMCGLERSAYNDLGLSAGSPSFDDHIGREHDPWEYVAFLAHLKRSRRLDRTGAETFVNHAIATGGTWVPSKTSFVLEAQGKTGPDDDDDDDGDDNDNRTGGAIANGKLEKALRDLLVKLDKETEDNGRRRSRKGSMGFK